MTGGKRWKIRLLCSTVSLKLPGRLESSIRRAQQASQELEIPGERRYGVDVRVHPGAAAAYEPGRW